MSRAERLAYSRGYYAGINGRWPEHLPPILPDGVLADLIAAAVEVEACIDNYYAIGAEDDDDNDPFGFTKAKEQILDALAAVRSVAMEELDA